MSWINDGFTKLDKRRREIQECIQLLDNNSKERECLERKFWNLQWRGGFDKMMFIEHLLKEPGGTKRKYDYVAEISDPELRSFVEKFFSEINRHPQNSIIILRKIDVDNQSYEVVIIQIDNEAYVRQWK